VNKTLSVCIPTYQRPTRLRNVLSCLYVSRGLTNTHIDWDVIVSVNGDYSLYRSVIDEFSYPWIQFIQNRRGNSFGKNLENLILECNSEYVLFQGDDDYISANLISQVVDFVGSDNSTDLCVVGCSGSVQDSSLRGYRIDEVIRSFRSDRVSEAYHSACLLHTFFEPICGLVVRSAILKGELICVSSPIKLIFPQHCLLPLTNTSHVKWLDCDPKIKPRVNIFEDISDKTFKDSGILTLSFGLAERIINRLCMIVSWGLLEPSGFSASALILALLKSGALLTNEFIRTDSDYIAAAIDNDLALANLFIEELSIMPVSYLIDTIFFCIYEKSNNQWTSLMFCLLAIQATFMRYTLFYGQVEDRCFIVVRFIDCMQSVKHHHPSLGRIYAKTAS
jgi:hypothetical protein